LFLITCKSKCFEGYNLRFAIENMW